MESNYDNGIIPDYTKIEVGEAADAVIDLLGLCCVGISRTESGDIIIHTDGGEASPKRASYDLVTALAKLVHRQLCWEHGSAILHVGEHADPTQWIAIKTCQLVAFRNYTKKGYWQDAKFLLTKTRSVKEIYERRNREKADKSTRKNRKSSGKNSDAECK